MAFSHVHIIGIEEDRILRIKNHQAIIDPVKLTDENGPEAQFTVAFSFGF